MAEPTCHVPVMLPEVLEALDPQSGQIVVDGTLGGGGHSLALADKVTPNGRVISVDLDAAALDRVQPLVGELPVTLAQANYAALPELLARLDVPAVHGILLDLGLSSDQLADTDRGFSFQSEGELDLRFDAEQGEPAWQLLSYLNEKALADLIYRYGEERFSRRIARRIVEARKATPIRTVPQLARLVRSCVPRSRGHQIDPATRTFQALRIAVNEELASLETALATFPNWLATGGRLAIISFHSLEDRLVKHAFRTDERLEVLTKKPIQPTEAECKANPRARSAKLRIAEKVEVCSVGDDIQS